MCIADKYISNSQSAFLPGRFILDGAVTLHETLHELNKLKQDVLILKLDLKKGYDKIKWPFLQQALRIKGFSPKWCEWIHKVMSKVSVAVRVNDDIGPFFQTHKGFRQGDPLSPILFNLAADVLAVLIQHAKQAGQIRGVVPHLVENGLFILQYADDTILLLHHDI